MQAQGVEQAGTTAQSELLSLSQAAEFLDVSKSTMYRLLDQGKLRSLKAGRQWRFRREDLYAYLNRSPVALVSAPDDALDAELAFFREQSANAAVSYRRRLHDADTTDSVAERVRALVGTILAHGFISRASDIHLDPIGTGDADHVWLRLRVDGVLHEVRRIPSSLQEALTVGFKSLAGMDTDESRIPQDGRIWVTINGRDLDMRVAVVPTPFGESLTTRIMDPASVRLTLDDLRLTSEDLGRVEDWLGRSYGLILITGPTGSGKTTTLYTCMQKLARPEVKVVTVEDPVEYFLPHATQIQVNPKAGSTVARCADAVLRLDPDIVMVCEIQDEIVAMSCCRLALTGHLVLSQMHMDASVSALMRLRDWGTDPFILSSALTGIASQRLVRRLCPACRAPIDPPPALLDRARALAAAGGYILPEEAAFFSPVGCEKCHGGYRGRASMIELLSVTPAVADAFLRGGTEQELRQIAIAEGMRSLAADGLRKAAEGLTSVQEVLRVLS